MVCVKGKSQALGEKMLRDGPATKNLRGSVIFKNPCLPHNYAVIPVLQHHCAHACATG